MASTSERRATQKRVAKQLKAGENPIAGYGKRAKEVLASNTTRGKTSSFRTEQVPYENADSPTGMHFGKAPATRPVKTNEVPRVGSGQVESSVPLLHAMSGLQTKAKPAKSAPAQVSPAATIGRQFSAIQQAPHIQGWKGAMSSPVGATRAYPQLGPTIQTPAGMANTLKQGLAANPNGPQVTYSRKTLNGPAAPNAAQQRITRNWRVQQHQAQYVQPKLNAAAAAKAAYTSGQGSSSVNGMSTQGQHLPPSGPVRKAGPMSGGGPVRQNKGPMNQGGKPMPMRNGSTGVTPSRPLPINTSGSPSGGSGPVTPNSPLPKPSPVKTNNVQQHMQHNQRRNERVVQHGKSLAEHLAAATSGGLPDRGRISA